MASIVGVAQWYAAHFWPERVAHYDAHLYDLRQASIEEAHAQTAKDIAAKQLLLVHRAQQFVADQLEKTIAFAEESIAPHLKPRELIRLAEQAIKLSRLIRGETTENVGIEEESDLSHLSDAELEACIRKLDGDNAAKKPSNHH